MGSARTYFIVKPKLRGYALIIAVMVFVSFLLTVYMYFEGIPLYWVVDALVFLGVVYVSMRMIALSFYTYKITDTSVEKSKNFITDNVHKMPIRRIQSYEIHAGLLDKLAGTATMVLKHAARDKPTMSLHCVGVEYIESIENAIELIIRKDIRGPDNFDLNK